MYKVYFGLVHDKKLNAEIQSVLQKNGFRCTSEEFRTHASMEEIEEAIQTSDACVFYPADGMHSLYDTIELKKALYRNRLVVIIRTSPMQHECSGVPFEEIDMSHSVIVNLFGETSIDELPGLLTELIQIGEDQEEFYWFSRSQVPDDPYEGQKDYLYISFADQDRLKAYRIIQKLQRDGYRVWYSKERKADEQGEKIAALIQHCCCMIAMISPSYIDSEDCRDEISLARDLNKERLLVYLEKTNLPLGMSMRLLRLQAVHKYTYKTRQEFYDKLYSAKGIAAAKM